MQKWTQCKEDPVCLQYVKMRLAQHMPSCKQY